VKRTREVVQKRQFKVNQLTLDCGGGEDVLRFQKAAWLVGFPCILAEEKERVDVSSFMVRSCGERITPLLTRLIRPSVLSHPQKKGIKRRDKWGQEWVR